MSPAQARATLAWLSQQPPCTDSRKARDRRKLADEARRVVRPRRKAEYREPPL